ncbi:hypothetical protein QBC41DRAFT_227961 [Cercophora samala]|uniref:FAD-binding domain-containing protein n=1 Tax=Cercophora samala TaxID=330535 RepID=A0AA39ZB46_9PEZI|nr:hypothetical protein QBC41DRAFT_227961 [Cercophora samala]
MNDPKPLPRIAIIGGGVTGLLLAQGLQKHGYPVTVYERQPEHTTYDREWTMILHWAWPVIARMLPETLHPDIHTAYGDSTYAYDKPVEEIPFYNGTTGELMAKVPAPNCRRMSRTRMRKLCSRGLDIRWGVKILDMEVVGEEGPVRLFFCGDDKGEEMEEEVDVVIGADGAGSFVRRWLFDGQREVADAKNSTVAIGNGLVRYDDVELAGRLREESKVCVIATMPGRTFVSAAQEVLDPDDPLTWTFHTAWMWTQVTPIKVPIVGEEARALVKKRAAEANLAELFRSAIDKMPNDATFVVSQLKYWVTVPWNGRSGRVTLAGDAAHALLPARGQGLNQALADVDSLLSVFIDVKDSKPDLKAAVGRYEEDVFERGRKAALGSLEDAKDFMATEGFEKGTGRTAMEAFRRIEKDSL